MEAMESWSLFLSVILNPIKALQMIAYQHLICSANTPLPLKRRLQYDVIFCTLAAASSFLCWDQWHPDLWLECLALSNKAQQHWPHPYCKATNHFPENYPRSPFCDSKLISRTPELRTPILPICEEFNQGCYTRAILPCSLESLSSHLLVLLGQPPLDRLPQKPGQMHHVNLTQPTYNHSPRQLHFHCRPQLTCTHSGLLSKALQ